MKSLVFDTSTIITLAMNNLLWMLEPLKKQFKGMFYISSSVRREIIDNPLESKKFRFEAMQVRSEIAKGNMALYDDTSFASDVKETELIVNHIFYARGNPITILQMGEIGALVLAEKIKADALVVDERSTRLIVESPKLLQKILHDRLHTNVTIDGKNLRLFQDRFGKLMVLRSVELAVIAYEIGVLDRYATQKGKGRDVLEAVLWGMKLRGCSVSEDEIEEIVEASRR